MTEAVPQARRRATRASRARRSWRAVGITVVVLLAGGVVPVPTVGASEVRGGTAPAVLRGLTDEVRPGCGPGDRPEPGASGQVPLRDQLSGRSRDGYSCNLRWVGGTRLGGVGGDTQMTWYGPCAYRVVPATGALSDGVAVVDLSDPARPVATTVLREPEWVGQGGFLNVHEGVHASAASGLLVVPAGRFLTTYDVATDCTRPRLLSTFDTGQAADLLSQAGLQSGFHSGQLSPDGTFFYGTTAGFEGFLAPVGPCLTVVDLLDPVHPEVVTRWGEGFPCHDLGFDLTGDRAFVGSYAPLIGHPSAVLSAFTPVGLPSKAFSGMTVIDTSEIQARRPGGRIVRLGHERGADQHTETFARIGGRDYVIGAEEATCPNGNARIVDVSDPARPRQVSELSLGVNRLAGCAATVLEKDRASNLLLYTSHYVSVDDPADASLAFVSWYSSGLRVFDIRDPLHPVEVAYFNPPVGPGGERVHDSTTTYPRYVPETGQVWVGSAVNALWVVELDPALRPEALRAGAPEGPPRRGGWSSDARTGPPDRDLLEVEVRVTPTPLACTLAIPPLR